MLHSFFFFPKNKSEFISQPRCLCFFHEVPDIFAYGLHELSYKNKQLPAGLNEIRAVERNIFTLEKWIALVDTYEIQLTLIFSNPWGRMRQGLSFRTHLNSIPSFYINRTLILRGKRLFERYFYSRWVHQNFFACFFSSKFVVLKIF